MCHTRVTSDGQIILGAQGNFPFHAMESYRANQALKLGKAEADEKLRDEWRKESAAPWAQQPEIASITQRQVAVLQAMIPPGVFQRHGTRPAYPAKIPDLIGIKEQQYLDPTGLGQHRSIEDLMRYVGRRA